MLMGLGKQVGGENRAKIEQTSIQNSMEQKEYVQIAKNAPGKFLEGGKPSALGLGIRRITEIPGSVAFGAPPPFPSSCAHRPMGAWFEGSGPSGLEGFGPPAISLWAHALDAWAHGPLCPWCWGPWALGKMSPPQIVLC